MLGKFIILLIWPVTLTMLMDMKICFIMDYVRSYKFIPLCCCVAWSTICKRHTIRRHPWSQTVAKQLPFLLGKQQKLPCWPMTMGKTWFVYLNIFQLLMVVYNNLIHASNAQVLFSGIHMEDYRCFNLCN